MGLPHIKMKLPGPVWMLQAVILFTCTHDAINSKTCSDMSTEHNDVGPTI